jgi:hypothetical protein
MDKQEILSNLDTATKQAIEQLTAWEEAKFFNEVDKEIQEIRNTGLKPNIQKLAKNALIELKYAEILEIV